MEHPKSMGARRVPNLDNLLECSTSLSFSCIWFSLRSCEWEVLFSAPSTPEVLRRMQTMQAGWKMLALPVAYVGGLVKGSIWEWESCEQP